MELGIFCYEVLTLPIKQFSGIWNCICISCKCILQTPGQPLEKVKKRKRKRNIVDMARKERRCLNVNQKNRKRLEDKYSKNGQRQQRENSNK